MALVRHILSENERLRPQTIELAPGAIEVSFKSAAKQQVQPVSRPEFPNLGAFSDADSVKCPAGRARRPAIPTGSYFLQWPDPPTSAFR
ncbi:MAG: hypothetical protein ABF303_17900 [Desulfobacterales bacterium]|jgi:hypothetical protein